MAWGLLSTADSAEGQEFILGAQGGWPTALKNMINMTSSVGIIIPNILWKEWILVNEYSQLGLLFPYIMEK